MKKFKIKTLGCKVNQYETQLMRERLLSAGHTEAVDEEAADLCIVNTCTVTAKADKESREILRRFLRENPNAEVVAAGCYVEAASDILKAIDKRVRVAGNRDKLDILKLLKDRDCFAPPDFARGKSLAMTKGDGITNFHSHTKAFVKVQDGCSNFCSYCIVPHVRGPSHSRDPDSILKEITRLIDKGYRELVLTGVCLGDFGKDLGKDKDLRWLIGKACAIEGDFRLRLSSIELPDVTDELIGDMQASTKLCCHLHIPLQSGDDEILKRMNRRYTASCFVDRVRYIRSQIPDIALTTDVIVGFPGEGDRSFKVTMETLKQIRPSRAHIFTYSPRKGTVAFDMDGNIPFEARRCRLKELKALTDTFAHEFREKANKNLDKI